MMNSFFRNGSPYLVPLLFIIILLAFVLLKNHASSLVLAGYNLQPEDISSSELAPVPNDRDHLVLTVHLTSSGSELIKVLQQTHPGDSSARLDYQGTSLGKVALADNMDLTTLHLTLPTRDAIAARMTINK